MTHIRNSCSLLLQSLVSSSCKLSHDFCVFELWYWIQSQDHMLQVSVKHWKDSMGGNDCNLLSSVVLCRWPACSRRPFHVTDCNHFQSNESIFWSLLWNSCLTSQLWSFDGIFFASAWLSAGYYIQFIWTWLGKNSVNWFCPAVCYFIKFSSQLSQGFQD